MPRAPRSTPTMSTPPRFPGITIAMAGTTYIVPPLNIRDFSRFREQIQTLAENDGGTSDLTRLEQFLELCLAALRRNYATMTLEDLLEIVDLRTFPRLLNAALGQLPADSAPVEDRAT